MNAIPLKNVAPLAEQTTDFIGENSVQIQLLTLNELDFVGGGADIVNLG